MKLSNISVKKITISQLEKEIKIPKFQRHLVWKDEDKKELLKSIISQKPIGTIILWQTKEHKFLIDGLQRFSTIKLLKKEFYAFIDFEWLIEFYIRKFNKKDYNVYLDNGWVSSFSKKYYEEIKNYRENLINNDNYESIWQSLCILFDEDKNKKNIGKGLNDLYLEKRELIKIFSKIFKDLSLAPKNFNSYELISIVWESDIEEEVISGFEKLNKQGKKLTHYDLLFSYWSAKDKSRKLKLSNTEMDYIQDLYREKNLPNNMLPKVNQDSLTSPEIIWLIMKQSEVLQNKDKNLLSNILHGVSKNEKIYLFSFILIFCFNKYQLRHTISNTNVKDSLKNLHKNIQSLTKEEIINLSNNIKIINNSISQKLKFIHTPDSPENPRNFRRHNVKKNSFLIIYGIALKILQNELLQPKSQFYDIIQNNSKIKYFLDKLDWEILLTLVYGDLKSGTNENAFKYVHNRYKEIMNENFSISKDWDRFENEIKHSLRENSKKMNFTNIYTIIQLVNSYQIDETKDEFRGYHLDHLIPKGFVKGLEIDNISHLGNLSIIPSVQNIRKKDQIDQKWFKNDFINDYISKNIDEEEFDRIQEMYNDLPSLKSKHRRKKIQKNYNEIIKVRCDAILEHFEEEYLKKGKYNE